jgi:hypothetical protein
MNEIKSLENVVFKQIKKKYSNKHNYNRVKKTLNKICMKFFIRTIL